MRRDSIQKAHEAELEALNHQHEMDKLGSKYGMEATLEAGVKLRITPCMDEFIQLNKDPEQMAAQGISTAQERQEYAELRSNEVALNDIKTRFLGVIKNGTEYYSKQSETYGGGHPSEAQLENLAIAAGEKAINKLFIVGCRQFAQDKYSKWICYEALYVPIPKVLDAIMEEVKNLDIDKEMYRKRLEAELANNAAKENAALELQRQQAE
ncbi:MAG: hypothetical protein MJ007_03165 [Paludibacteraceae bacterium]|nr:hypothetical protein [Paludibacteraceae bacterium]